MPHRPLSPVSYTHLLALRGDSLGQLHTEISLRGAVRLDGDDATSLKETVNSIKPNGATQADFEMCIRDRDSEPPTIPKIAKTKPTLL